MVPEENKVKILRVTVIGGFNHSATAPAILLSYKNLVTNYN